MLRRRSPALQFVILLEIVGVVLTATARVLRTLKS